VPIELTSVALNEATANVSFMGEIATVTYRPRKITTGRMFNAQRAMEGGDQDAFHMFLVEVIADWDVTNEGEKFAITKENMAELPVQFLRAVFHGIVEDTAKGEAGRRSNAG
jgi:hypothetical protein